ncbi:unnamed protein product [Rotaria magnacalcarata]|uniref:Uncharacterized protein n=1 Tax=Rotaria magnacalcarata TaxID=392030 RepID=A0A820B5P4_9BILA|nr:unnamed protein product [Rotaria magnacalcarata]CAF2149238.1 unnamed protein product [Rotaria magnacalcarata]CAF4201170.1 unnamed protein product [Rotaria magnacalcarata]CAF4202563.1 unnamed protein product [Rotaria magnacalcarata]
MLGNSRVAPVDENSNSDVPSTPGENTSDDVLLRYFLKYVRGKTCYDQHAAHEAKIISRTQKAAFESEIWTLIEKRSINWEEIPDDGDDAQGEAVGKIFEKYHYNSPDTTLNKLQRGGELLRNTRKKDLCPDCHGNGKIQCFLCSGSGTSFGKKCPKCSGQSFSYCKRCATKGNIIRTARMSIEWRTIYSHECHENTFLPDDLIKKAEFKTELVNNEEFCKDNSLDATFPHLRLEIQKVSPVNFAPFLQKQFTDRHKKEVDESTKIRKIRCSIKMANVLEVRYQSDTYTNPRSQEGKL